MENMKKGFNLVLVILFFVNIVSAEVIELVGEGFIPEPNEEITVQIQTDTPLFAMGIGIYVVGDANIISAMNPEDCNNYGWDSGWNCVPYIDPNGWVFISGVRWDADANGIIGYFKFRYNSGQVIVYIDQEYSTDIAFDWDSRSSSYVPFSTDTLVFGEPDPNDSNQQGNSFSQNENIPATESTNDVNLPLNNFWQNEQEKRQKYLIRGPAGSDSSGKEAFNKAKWQEQFQLEKNSGGGQMLLDSNEPNIIEVNSDITTNQIWTANNVYYIVHNINVSALLIIEPGTLIVLEYYGALSINTGGTLISCGTPDKPIIFTPFWWFFWHTEDIGDYWQYMNEYGTSSYYCAVWVEQTASPATTIAYNFIEGAFLAVVTDGIRLDNPIEDNYIFGNTYGIYERGPKHTDINNNLLFCNDSSSIEVYLEDVNGVGDANSVVTIANNTCDYYQTDGIYIHGVIDANQAGTVILLNNIVSQSYRYGLHMCDSNEYMYATVANTGYYNDPCNKNWDFPEYNPVQVTEPPYIHGESSLDWHYLSQNCPFVNAGLEYIEQTPLIGKTTDINSIPDSNKIDIGFHHPNWNFSNAGDGSTLQADYDGNFKVDFKDFAILANGWQNTYDINDLAEMANEWLSTISGHPPIAISVNGDANNLSGEVSIGVAGCSYSTSDVYIFADGQLIEKTDYEDEGTPGIVINTPSYRNGSHLLKAVVIDHNNLITLSENADVNFNNPLHCLSINDTYEPNQSLRLLGLSATDNNLMVKLSKWDGEVVWSQQTSGDLDITIPGSVLTGQIYDMSVAQETTGSYAMNSSSSWEPIWEKAINKKYNPNGNGRFQFAIFLPNDVDIFPWPTNPATARKKAVAGIINSCDIMGIRYVILYKDQCTWENFTRVLVGPMSSDIIYVYLVARGGSSPEYAINGTAQRSWIKLTDDHVVSNLNAPLGGDWDNNEDVHSMADLGLGDSYKLKMVWIDTCFLGKYQDMANAWMKGWDEPGAKQLYVSWSTGIQISNESCFCDWTAFFFGYPDPNEGFGLYGANSYYQAFEDACRWNHVCESGTISGKVQTYGDTSVLFTGNRYDF